ncbi:MAG: phosphate ABC transporter substrate-binding/OmpA family protein [Deltaproteobacteria bacterium]|nr:phosphate ABC transporter substrate-binding/OmpA family protein [Deltaproteobacteria bacterium]
MPKTIGKCVNFGMCDTADNKSVIEMEEGQARVCPECGSSLKIIQATGGGKGKTLSWVAGIAIVLVIAGVGLFYGLAGSPPPKPEPAKIKAAQRVEPARTEKTAKISPADKPANVPQTQPGQVILRLHGSNTIGSKLGPALAEQFLKNEGAKKVIKVPSQKEEEETIRGDFGDTAPAKLIEVHAHGSTTAFNDLFVNNCDIGMASRKIKDDEIKKLEEAGLGDMTSPNSEHTLALDGIAVIVNRGNPVKSLSVEQLRGIFSGEISDWAAVKGAPGKIRVCSRDNNSGTYDTFKSLVLHDKKLAAASERYEDSNLLSDAVANDPKAIGFIGLPYIRSAQALEIVESGASPILPSFFTVAREDYPLSRRLFLYTAESPKNPWVRKFIDFALSKEGQDIAKQAGFIDQTIKAEKAEKKVADASGPLDNYGQLTKNLNQLSTNFRFKASSDKFDNRAIRDLDRVVQILIQPTFKGKDFYLFGFTDNKGDEQFNVALSKSRALAVANELRKRGADAKMVDGLGPGHPVASNDTKEGRDKNRRVEIWIN